MRWNSVDLLRAHFHRSRRHSLGLTQHWKEFCISALKLQACCLFLGSWSSWLPVSHLNVQGPFHDQMLFPHAGRGHMELGGGSVWMCRRIEHCWSVLWVEKTNSANHKTERKVLNIKVTLTSSLLYPPLRLYFSLFDFSNKLQASTIRPALWFSFTQQRF